MRKQILSTAASGASAYNFLQNGDFATTRGLELVFKTRRTRRLRSELNYTFSDARGTGSTTVSALSGVENDSGLPTIIAPLDFNQTHRGNIYLDYRYAAGDGGLLQRAGANLLLKFDSGHNYTLVDGTIGQRGPELGGILACDDPRNRSPIGGINRATTPWTFEVDLRVDKGFALFGTDVRAYAYVLNLFNRRNDINVYGRTGNAGDDGFLTDPQLSGQIVEASGGDTYEELYRAINLDHRQHYWFTEGGDLYGAPRQVRFGLQFDL